MTYEQAEILSLKALSHVAGHEDILLAYLSLSGMTLEALRNSASAPATLASILDYFLQNEKRLMTFCRAENILPDQLAKARQFLPGGETIAAST